MLVRPAHESDFAQVTELLEELGRPRVAYDRYGDVRDLYLSQLDDPDAEHLVAVESGAVVGFCSMHFRRRLNRMDPESLPAYNIRKALLLDGALDVERWEAALRAVVARHEVLRSFFELVDEHPDLVFEFINARFERFVRGFRQATYELAHRGARQFGDTASAPRNAEFPQALVVSRGKAKADHLVAGSRGHWSGQGSLGPIII